MTATIPEQSTATEAEALPPPQSPPRSRRVPALLSRPAVTRLAMELIVVFVGVTSAFWLENWRERRERDRRAAGVEHALADELRVAGEMVGPRLDALLRTRLGEWDERRRQGHRPPVVIYPIGAAPRPPTAVWDAAIGSGLADLMEPRMVFCLGRFYNRFKTLGEGTFALDHFTTERIVPFLDDPEWFYDAQGSLKPEYRAYMQQVRKWGERQARLSADARALVNALETPRVNRTCPLR